MMQDLDVLTASPGKESRSSDSSSAETLVKDFCVGQVLPNRVCCNAVLAALSRAKPPQWHLVGSPTNLFRHFYTSVV